MSFRDKIEDHPIVWLLATLAVGYSAGLGTYQAILEIAHLQVVPESAIDMEPPPLAPSNGPETELQGAVEDPEWASRQPTEEAASRSGGGSPPPPANHTQVVRDIKFQFDECDGTTDCILCDIRATALKGDQEIDLYNGDLFDKTIISRAIDPKGHEIPASRVGYGASLTTLALAKSELIEGVPLSLRIEICNFEEGDELALVEVSLKDDRGQFRVPFRSVPVRRR